jgi:hypothetical protein
MSRTRRSDDPPAPADDSSWNDLERVLVDALPGFEPLAHDLELSSSERADCVGVDGNGRLTLVLDAGGEGEEPVLRALDALSFARRNGEAIARHLDCPRLRSELSARVVLVAEGFSRKLIERMVPLAGNGVDLYELRELRTRERVSAWLAPAQSLEGSGGATGATEESFLGGLDARARELAQTLLAKMRRLDPDVEVLPSRRSVAWRHAGAMLGRIESYEGRLYAAVAPRHDSRALESASDLERFLEQLLGRFVELLGPAISPQRAASPETAAAEPALTTRNPAAPAPPEARLGAIPLLTQDEYDAFHKLP